jgi:isoquinoline 1-oxidoreductase subunit beta
MNNMSHNFFQSQALAEDRPVNLSRRSFLGASLGALILGVALPDSGVRAQGAAAAAVKPGTRVSAFLEIHADSTVLLRSPFIEGGQASSPEWRRSSGRSWTLIRPGSLWNARRRVRTIW